MSEANEGSEGSLRAFRWTGKESGPRAFDVLLSAASAPTTSNTPFPFRILETPDEPGESEPWFEGDGLGPEPNGRAIAVVDELYTTGHTTLVWTARPWSVAGERAG